MEKLTQDQEATVLEFRKRLRWVTTPEDLFPPDGGGQVARIPEPEPCPMPPAVVARELGELVLAA